MFQGLQTSGVRAKTGFFYPQLAASVPSAVQGRKNAKQTLSGFPSARLAVRSYDGTFLKQGLYKLDTVNYANPTTETRTQVLELGPRY